MIAKCNLDPDFRKDPPSNADGTDKPHCCRCRKEIRDLDSAIQVTVNWETWEVADGWDVDMQYHGSPRVIGNELIGPDCARKIGFEHAQKPDDSTTAKREVSRIPLLRLFPCKRNIEMTPLCNIEVTLPRVLGSREERRGGGVDEQAGIQPS